MSKRRVIGIILSGCIVAAFLYYGRQVLHSYLALSQCQGNLHCFDSALQCYVYPPVTNYPPTLASLDETYVSVLNFVCPEATPWRTGTGSSGQINDQSFGHTVAEMDKWTDYIYVSGLFPTYPSNIPVVICPPINHRGKGGNVLFVEHSARWILSPEIDGLIDQTYAFAASNGLRVVVSEGLTRRSGGRYKSSP